MYYLEYFLNSRIFRLMYFYSCAQAVLLVADDTNIFELTGNGDVLEPEHGVMGKFKIHAVHSLLLYH